jgi:phosphoribosylformylglycinamidine synthase
MASKVRAARMPAMPSASLMVMLMRQDYPIGLCDTLVSAPSPSHRPVKSQVPVATPQNRLPAGASSPTPPTQAVKVTLHLTTIAGGNALSPFRAQQLQPALEAIHPKIAAIAARFVHLVATDAPPTPEQHQRLAALLTYGDPYQGPLDGAGHRRHAAPGHGVALGLQGHRHCAQLRAAGAPCGTCRGIPRADAARPAEPPHAVARATAAQVAALLHDRMTESVLFDLADAQALFTRPADPSPWSMWTCWAGAGPRWSTPTPAWGLALADDEIDYLVNAFGI